jgi:molybdopterin converting factor small subunit
VDLNDRSTLFDLYNQLKMPLLLRLVCFPSVNYEKASWGTELQDGDTITFLMPISGG